MENLALLVPLFGGDAAAAVTSRLAALPYRQSWFFNATN